MFEQRVSHRGKAVEGIMEATPKVTMAELDKSWRPHPKH